MPFGESRLVFLEASACLIVWRSHRRAHLVLSSNSTDCTTQKKIIFTSLCGPLRILDNRKLRANYGLEMTDGWAWDVSTPRYGREWKLFFLQLAKCRLWLCKWTQKLVRDRMSGNSIVFSGALSLSKLHPWRLFEIRCLDKSDHAWISNEPIPSIKMPWSTRHKT